MPDILKYRIPENGKVIKTGRFREVQAIHEASGFFLSTFLMDKFFEFVPTTSTMSTPFFHMEEPHIIEKKAYIESAKSFLNAFEKKKIKKAVFSRIKKVAFDELKIDLFFDALCEAYPSAFVYLISGEEVGTWIGASPETLLQVFSNSGFTMALAGTKTVAERDNDWGEKEIQEQAYVTGFIQDKLMYLGVKNIEIYGPYDIQAGPIIHLRTDISFDIDKNKILDIAKKLHPTPAISGLPQKEAIDLINFREVHERQFYCGMIGVIDQNFSSLYVNLRCCQIQKGAAYLYLGGGFTEDSDPELEWEETENKSRTLMNIIEKL